MLRKLQCLGDFLEQPSLLTRSDPLRMQRQHLKVGASRVRLVPLGLSLNSKQVVLKEARAALGLSLNSKELVLKEVQAYLGVNSNSNQVEEVHS